MNDNRENLNAVPDDAGDWDVISVYTRRQAIADGVLVDMTTGEPGELLREAGFRLHTAMTAGAFAAAIGGHDLPAGQDVSGRWWDVLMVLRAAIRRSPGTDRVNFTVSVWDGTRHNDVRLWCHCGPGDAGEPALTIMLQGED